MSNINPCMPSAIFLVSLYTFANLKMNLLGIALFSSTVYLINETYKSNRDYTAFKQEYSSTKMIYESLVWADNQTEFDISFPLLLAAAEKTPFQSGTFDLVISEYGACLWSDPYAWIPEASRILKPGGKLVFITNSFLSILCLPDEPDSIIGNSLIRPQFDLHQVEWPNDPEDNGVEFHLSHGNWIKLFRANDLEVEDLIELRPDDNAKTRFEYLTHEWSDQWASEEVWKLQKKERPAT